jgi:hypothetical protein
MPPFKSNQDYNVLFAESAFGEISLRGQDSTRAAAQIMAFEDTWRWDEDSLHVRVCTNLDIEEIK